MTQEVNLKYGTSEILFYLPSQAEILQIDDPEQRITRSRFEGELCDTFERLNPDLSTLCIVLGDKTRLCGYPEYLPVLLQALVKFGARLDRITAFIAYGTHARQTENVCLAAYGNTYRQIRFVHHDCTNHSSFINLGTTSRKTPVWIPREIVEAGFLMTFGAISHHYFAGFGGGRKLIFPGLGRKESIDHNHGLFLDSERRTLSPFCQSGLLDKNPLAEDLAEYETFRPADLAIHGILDSRGNVCRLLPGVGIDHFRNACAEHGKNCEITSSSAYDLVIASCGGFPRDINFIQSHKAIENAAGFVRHGGTLIVLAECRDGIGSNTFLPWFEMGNWEDAFDRLSKNYEGNGGTALSMMLKSKRIQIFMVTNLDDSICETIGVKKISRDQATLRVKQSRESIAAIPNAGMLVKRPV